MGQCFGRRGLDFRQEGSAMFRTLCRCIAASVILASSLILLVAYGGNEETGYAHAAAGAPGAVNVPAPLEIASDQVMAYVTIPDLGTMLEHMESIAAAFAPPGEFQPGMIKMQVGGMLGDPGLIHLDGAMPLVLMVFKADTPGEPPQVAGFMKHNEAAPYGETLAGTGMQFKVNDGVLTLAQTPEALATAEKEVSEYRKIAATGVKNDLRVTLHMDRLMDTYGALVRSQVDQMAGMITGMSAMGQPGTPGPAEMAPLGKVLKLEVKGILAILEQIDVVQYDVSLSANAIELDEIVAAKAGTAMADLLSTRPAGQNRSLSLLSEPGYVTMASQGDPKKLSAFLAHILTQLSKDPEAAEFLTPELISMFADMGDCYAGDTALTVRQAEGSPFVSESVMAVKDEAKCLELMEKGMSILSPGSGFGKMYEDMGMKFSFDFEKDARNRAGVAVHRFKTTVDMENVPEMQAAQMKTMLPKDTEFAFVKGYYLASQVPAALDKMIDAAQAGTPSGGATLHAMRTFGDKQLVYFDLDFVGLMQASMAMMPQGMPNPMAPLLEGVSSTEPIVGAASCADGRARIQAKIPLGPFIQIAQRAQTM
jgi:hypothetical protein